VVHREAESDHPRRAGAHRRGGESRPRRASQGNHRAARTRSAAADRGCSSLDTSTAGGSGNVRCGRPGQSTRIACVPELGRQLDRPADPTDSSDPADVARRLLRQAGFQRTDLGRRRIGPKPGRSGSEVRPAEPQQSIQSDPLPGQDDGICDSEFCVASRSIQAARHADGQRPRFRAWNGRQAGRLLGQVDR
jgi:hypothetical protein